MSKRSDTPSHRNIFVDEDHKRGCEGRNYNCTCGYDERVLSRGNELEQKLSGLSAAPQSADLLEAIRLLELCVGNCDLFYDYHECMGVPLNGDDAKTMKDVVETFCARFR